MDTLGDELLGKIASYLPSLTDLKTLSITNQRLHSWVIVSPTADTLFRDFYRRQFPPADYCLDERVSGRELWQDTYYVCQSIRQKGRTGRGRVPTNPRQRRPSRRRAREEEDEDETATTTLIRADQPLNTVQVLPFEEEQEALRYDNHDMASTEQEPCLGYFGFQPLYNNNNKSHTPIAIWGDYAGLKVAPCWDALLNPDSEFRDMLVSIDDPQLSQVLVLRAHPSAGFLSAQGYTSPFFLAFSSGTVMALAYKGEQLETLSTSATHSGECTALAFLPPFPSCQHHHYNKHGYLLSVCNQGRVFLYPDALTKMDLSRKISLNPTDSPAFRVLSMSGTIFDRDHAVLCLGGQGLNIVVWHLVRDSEKEIRVLSAAEFPYKPSVDSDGQNDVENDDHSITHVSFVGPIANDKDGHKKDVLVMGTSLGHVATWDLLASEPSLEVRFTQEGTHLGSVESMQRVGNILLTYGGNDGMVKAFDLNTGLPLANILFHPGRAISPTPGAARVRIRCAVVKSWICHERQTLVGFCRDGHISEWPFNVPATKVTNTRKRAKKNGSTRSKKR